MHFQIQHYGILFTHEPVVSPFLFSNSNTIKKRKVIFAPSFFLVPHDYGKWLNQCQLATTGHYVDGVIKNISKVILFVYFHNGTSLIPTITV